MTNVQQTFNNVVVLGAGGMLGQALCRHYQTQGVPVQGLTRKDLDLTWPEVTLSETLDSLKLGPQTLVILAAAMTQVDEAETHPEQAMAINAHGTEKVAGHLAKTEATLVYISTDYVFDGTQTSPYATTHPPSPINAYGQSKWLGEQAVSTLCRRHYIARTSWLYGMDKSNFVSFVLDRARKQVPTNIVCDQVGVPTWTGSVCRLLEAMAEQPYGVYHLVDTGAVTRYEQAIAICQAAGLNTTGFKPVTMEHFPQPAKRPQYSVLAPESLPAAPWQEGLRAYLKQEMDGVKDVPTCV